MLDIKLLRENPARIKEEMEKLNSDAPIDEIISIDEKRRELIKQVDELKNIRNVVSKEISQIKDKAEKEIKIKGMHEVNARIKVFDEELKAVEEKLEDLLLYIPNIARPYVPIGKDESDNKVVKECGVKRKFDFTAKPHWEIAEDLDIIDFERGVKISGTRFFVLKGAGARLQRALINFMLDHHIKNHGYTEIYPPAMVKKDSMIGTGNLPKFAENLYMDPDAEMWFVPTAEVPVTNLYREEILSAEQLPIYHVAFSPCFRKEKASAGKDTRGIKRVHQFDKVELVKFVEPHTSDEELQKLLANAETIPQLLKITYRVVQMCTGDLSFVACAKFDIEMWSPGCDEWLEVSSCSSFWDFQARRANIKYRKEKGAKPEFVHTLNGSGLAAPRTIISILENYQEEDGSVIIPDVLRPYMGGQVEISKVKK